MSRLCERPGCSEAASVAYGMRPEDLVFWLDVLRPGAESSGGVLCRRHADTMVVPRNWTLDDLRDPDLHLFRPPPVDEAKRRRARRLTTHDDTAEQLRLGGFAEPVPVDSDADDAAVDPRPVASGEPAAAPVEEPVVAVADAPVVDESEPWAPSFDAADDLDGLLAARSPLLARAFRGDDRRR